VKWAALILLLVVAASACSAGADSQFLPIGSRCSRDDQCGTSPYDCAIADHPYGYCEKPCMLDSECPADSLCSTTVGECRRVCAADADCRVNDGYSCQPLESKGVCDLVPSSSMDVGAP
jgi:hypothetical protein